MGLQVGSLMAHPASSTAGAATASLLARERDQEGAAAVLTLGLAVKADYTHGGFRWLTVGVAGEPFPEIVLDVPGPPVMDEKEVSDGRTGTTPNSGCLHSIRVGRLVHERRQLPKKAGAAPQAGGQSLEQRRQCDSGGGQLLSNWGHTTRQVLSAAARSGVQPAGARAPSSTH